MKMVLKESMLILGFFLGSHINAQETSTPFKKIMVKAIYPTKIENSLSQLVYSEEIDTENLLSLKKYVLENSSLKSNPHLDTLFIFELLDWVHSRWEHDSDHEAEEGASSLDILKNASHGVRYRCVEYGRVLKDVLLSFGYLSRTVGIQHKDVAYGGFGMGHVATEVWSYHLKKWIFLDPQFNIHAEYKGNVLNFFELSSIFKNEKINDIEFIPGKYSINKNKKNDYKNFIKDYFGYLNISYRENEEVKKIILPLHQKEYPLTFQGLPVGGKFLFTNDSRDLYPKINQAQITFESDDKRDFSQIYSKYEISNSKDYKEKMKFFATEPHFNLTFSHNMPWFSHFEIKTSLNYKWKVLNDFKFNWILKEGNNVIWVRPVNKYGIYGELALVDIDYK